MILYSSSHFPLFPFPFSHFLPDLLFSTKEWGNSLSSPSSCLPPKESGKGFSQQNRMDDAFGGWWERESESEVAISVKQIRKETFLLLCDRILPFLLEFWVRKVFYKKTIEQEGKEEGNCLLISLYSSSFSSPDELLIIIMKRNSCVYTR